MAKLKKRIHNKKTTIKKAIKRTNNHNQSHHTKTAEQQSRDNEMLKVMLGRPQQIIPGQTQQNDKLQQQIDTANRTLNNVIQENNSLKDQYRRITEQQDEHLRERRQIKSDIKMNEKLRAENERQFNEMEALEKRRGDLENAIRVFEERKATLKGETEIGGINKQIEEYKIQQRKIEEQYNALKAEMERNKVYNQLEEVKHDVKNKATELQALKNIMASAEYKNPNEALIRAYTDKLLKERELEHQRQINEIKNNIANTEAQKQAYENYVIELEKPTARLLRTEHKGKANEKKVYETEKLTGPSLKAQHEAKLAEQLKIKTDQEQELYKQKKRFESATNLQKQLVDAENANAEKMTELKIMNAHTQSPEFMRNLTDMEVQRSKLYNEQQQAQILEEKAKTQRRIVEMNARNEVKQAFDPSNTEAAAIAAQMNELGNQYISTLSQQSNAADVEIQRRRKVNEIGNLLEEIGNRYDSESSKQKAFENVFDLISAKTEGKLDREISNYSLENATKAVEFIGKISNIRPEYLVDDGQISGLKEHEDFLNFEWNPV